MTLVFKVHARVSSQDPFILGLISSIQLLMAHYWPFLLVGQIQPVVTVGSFMAR